jgi:hemoglobin
MSGLYGTLGGRRAFDAAVADFYRRVAGDPELRTYFQATDMERLKAHQHSFLAMALGGPRAYVGRTMASAHSSLAITDEAFDRVLDHLVSTLVGLGVPAELIREIVTGLLGLRHDIVRVPGTEHDRASPAPGRSAAAPASPRIRLDPVPTAARVRPGPVPDRVERSRPAERARPYERSWPPKRPQPGAPGSLFEPHPDNPAHDRPVNRPRPAWQ